MKYQSQKNKQAEEKCKHTYIVLFVLLVMASPKNYFFCVSGDYMSAVGRPLVTLTKYVFKYFCVQIILFIWFYSYDKMLIVYRIFLVYFNVV